MIRAWMQLEMLSNCNLVFTMALLRVINRNIHIISNFTGQPIQANLHHQRKLETTRSSLSGFLDHDGLHRQKVNIRASYWTRTQRGKAFFFVK